MKIRDAVLLSVAAIFPTALAHAAGDAQVCYTQHVAVYSPMGYGTMTWPQLGNTSTFTCRSGVQYTMSQLAARDWNISQVSQVLTSTTTTETSSKQVLRFQMIIQK